MTAPATDGLVTDETLLGDATAVFDVTRTYRYLLTRTWGGGPAMVFIMLNPSKADAMISDPTVQRCKGFARREGYFSMAAVNLSALCATDPAALRRHPEPVGPRNDEFIIEHCTRAGLVVAGWGVHGALHGRDRHVAGMLRDAGVPLWCLGVTRGGSPRHPLYVRADAPLLPWEAPS